MAKASWIATAMAILLFVAGCGPATAKPATEAATSPVTEEPTTEVIPTSVTEAPSPQDCVPQEAGFGLGRSLSEAPYRYLDGVVLVLGFDAGQLHQLIQDIGLKTDPEFPEPQPIPMVGSDLFIEAYRYDQGVYGSVWEPISLILEQAYQSNVPVFAEPDWVVGSPWPVEGSPWPVEGSPTGPAQVTEYISAVEFWGQWAWTAVDVPESAGWSGHNGTTRVAVLDTSPFATEGEYSYVFGDSRFDLCVSHHEDLAKIGGVETGSHRQHGVSVAGMVRSTSPPSTIHLIRVLDAEATGDIITLLGGLSVVAEQAEDRQSGAPPPEKTVINMSLGFQPEADAALSLPAVQGYDPFSNVPQDFKNLLGECGETYLAEFALSLCFRLRELAARGITLVAAAGNSGYLQWQQGLKPVPDAPARWQSVLGVGASNMDGNPSCFSNPGEVYAPGGEGGTDGNGIDCEDLRAEVCGLNMDGIVNECQYGVITPALRTDDGPGGYADDLTYNLWAGSSFAAPIVSGMAACLLENDYSPADAAAAILDTFDGAVVNFGSLDVGCFP